MLQKINIFLYGEPGAGKTHQIQKLLETKCFKNILLIDFDRRAHVVFNAPNIKIIEIKSTDELDLIADELLKKEGRYKDIDTVIIDTFTEMVSVSMDEIAFASTEQSSRRQDQDRLEQSDYLVNTKKITRLCRKLRNSGRSLIFTGHSKAVYPKDINGASNKAAQPTAFIPRMSGELGTIVLSFMDLVFYLAVKGKSRKLIVRNVDQVYTRTSGDLGSNLPDVIDDPDLGAIMTEIFNNHNKG